MPVYLAFSLLFCPYPPTPFPSGEGGDHKLVLPGLRPRHPCGCACAAPEVGGKVVFDRGLSRAARMRRVVVECPAGA